MRAVAWLVPILVLGCNEPPNATTTTTVSSAAPCHGICSDADCADTEACNKKGQCTAMFGRCVIGKDADCKQRCDEAGECAVVPPTETSGSGECIATSDAQCASSTKCKEEGGCAVKNGACVPTSDAHCAPTRPCRLFGICEAAAGKCRRPPKPCKEMAACSYHGHCAGGEREKCFARSADECQKSESCKKSGACSLLGEHCLASCKDHPSCALHGWCTARGDKCVVGSDADCKRAATCSKDGACRAVDGTCVK